MTFTLTWTTRQVWSAADAMQRYSNMLNIAEIDERIAALRENLRELIEQAAAYSGAADEELTSRRIADQEVELERLRKQRDELSKSLSAQQLHRFGSQSGGETK
jgi:hypothetical protein